MHTHEVWDDAESSNGSVKERAIEFSHNVRSAAIVQYDDEGSLVAWTHFVVECLLNCCVTNEDESAELEIEVLDCVFVVFFEFYGSLDAHFVDTAMEFGEITVTLLKHNSMVGDNVCSREDRVGGQ